MPAGSAKPSTVIFAPGHSAREILFDRDGLLAGLRETRSPAPYSPERLEYTMADLGYRFPDYPVPPGETMVSFLRKMTQAGARERYHPYHDRARRQIERELDLIEKLDLAGFRRERGTAGTRRRRIAVAGNERRRPPDIG